MESLTVLVIDETKADAITCGQVLREEGHDVILAKDIIQGLSALRSTQPDVLVIDPRSSDFAAEKILQQARQMTRNMVVAYLPKSTGTERATCLLAGADAVVEKSECLEELIAQIRAFFRGRRGGTHDEQQAFDDGVIAVDFRARSVTVHGEQVELTPTEYRLLVALVKNLGSVMSNTELLASAWNDNTGIAPERVKFGILRLRRKLGAGAIRVEAVRGFGYRYERRTRAADRRTGKRLGGNVEETG